MENYLVGYRFSPTGEELVNHYLKNKILDKPWLVDHAINDINIYAHDPEFLPSLSKLESKDLIWYFFTPREYTASKKKGTKRTTPSGFWKGTGKDRIIKDKRGQIGIKKTLVYHQGKSANGVWTPWVMHEYHITSLPLTQRNYVICQVMYKGADGENLHGNDSNELVSASNTGRVINTTPEVEQDDLSLFDPDTFLNDSPSQQPQASWDDDYINELLTFEEGNYDDVLRDLDITTQAMTDCNNHRPKKALTGIIVDCSSDSDDAVSISETSYQGTSSPDSVDEIPSLRKDSITDIQPPPETSINRKSRKSRRTIPSKLEVKEGKSKAVDASMDKKKSSSSMVKTEKKGWFITEEAMQRNHRKSPPYICVMNMIIGLILLVAVIGNIISVLLSVKT